MLYYSSGSGLFPPPFFKHVDEIDEHCILINLIKKKALVTDLQYWTLPFNTPAKAEFLNPCEEHSTVSSKTSCFTHNSLSSTQTLCASIGCRKQKSGIENSMSQISTASGSLEPPSL